MSSDTEPVPLYLGADYPSSLLPNDDTEFRIVVAPARP